MMQTDHMADLRAEADRIAEHHPHVAGKVTAAVTVLAANASVTVETDGLYDWPVLVRLGVGEFNPQTLHLDCATARRLLVELDEAVTVCDGCERAVLREDTSRCAGSGATFCDSCHPSACTMKSECFFDDEFRDES